MKIARWLMLAIACLLATASVPVRGDDAPGAPPGNPHAQLHDILNRPQFTAWRLRQAGDMPDPAGKGKWSQFIDDQVQAIRDFIHRHLPQKKSHSYHAALSGHDGNGLPTFLHVAAWTVIAAIVIYLAIVLFKIFGARSAVTTARVLSQEQVREAMESGNALALDSAQWLEQARRLAGEQDFRAVYRALYLALLSGLHAAGKIEHNRNRTNWVYVAHYRGPAPERAQFSELTELFDRVWYGRKVADDRNLDQLRLDVAMLTRGEGAA